MLTRNRDYPEIFFVETDTEAITDALITGYQKITGRTLYRGDPMRLFILWVADLIVQERALIDRSAKMNVPRYAMGEFLDSLAENFRDVYRLQATAASVTLRFWITEPQPTKILVAKGTRATVEGEIIFETTEDLHIEPGSLFGEVSAVCLTLGDVGNGFDPGQIKTLVDIYPYYDKVENVTTSAGGADTESDDSFYERIRESVESFSTAGPVGAYEYHARSASALIVDVSAESPEPGVADIRVLCEGGQLPSEEILQMVYDQLTAEKVRPFCDHVIVSEPDTVGFSIDYTFYIPRLSQSGAATIIKAVEEAQQQYILWQTSRMGRDINPSYFHALLMQTGVKRVEIRQPEFVELPKGVVAVLEGDPVALNGGTEDE